MNYLRYDEERRKANREFGERKERWLRDYEDIGLANHKIGWDRAHREYEQTFGQEERDFFTRLEKETFGQSESDYLKQLSAQRNKPTNTRPRGQQTEQDIGWIVIAALIFAFITFVVLNP